MAFLSRQHKGSLFAMISGMGYGLLGYFGMTIIHEGWSVYNMLFWRFFIASVVVALIVVLKFKKRNDNWLEMLKVVLYGMIFYGPTAAVYFVVSKSIGTGLAMVIFFTFPAMVMVLNLVLYRQPIKRAYIGAFALIALGMCFLVGVGGGGARELWGVAMGIFSALLYAFYIIQSKYNNVSPYVATLMVSIGCTLSGLIMVLVDQSFVVPATWVLWKNIVAMGVISTAIPIVLMLESFRYISAEMASILCVSEPITVVACGILFLGETVNVFQGIGVVAILAGVLITLMSKSTSK